MLLHYRNLDHLLNIGGHQVGVSLVDVASEARQGVLCLPTQSAGEGLGVGQHSVGLQTGNSLESSLTNLRRGEGRLLTVSLHTITYLALQSRVGGTGGGAAGGVQQAGDGVGGLRV